MAFFADESEFHRSCLAKCVTTLEDSAQLLWGWLDDEIVAKAAHGYFLSFASRQRERLLADHPCPSK